MFLLLCLPSGCGHPLGSLVCVVTVSEALFYTGCDAPFQGPSLGMPILGASNHGYFSVFAFYVDFWLLV